MQTNLLLLIGANFHTLNHSLQEEIYREFYHFLYKPILYMIKDHPTAEDIIQETFMTALSKCPIVENEDHMKAWIKVVAKNVTINHIRRRKKFHNDVSLEAAGEAAAFDPVAAASVEQEVEAKSLEDHISQHLQEMKPEHRTLIELKWKKGLTYKEIAQETRETELSVKHKLHRARTYLKRKLLKDWGSRDE